MNIFSLASLFLVITNVTMALILFCTSRGRKQNIIWGYFCIAVAFWGWGAYQFSLASTLSTATFWWQFANIGTVFSPILYYHFVSTYTDRRNKFLLMSIYVVGVGVLMINFFAREIYIGELRFMFGEFYYHDWTIKKTPIYMIFYIAYFWILMLYSFFLLLRKFISSAGILRNQIKYFIVAMSIGWVGMELFFLYLDSKYTPILIF